MKALHLPTEMGCFSNTTTVCTQGLNMVILQYQCNLKKLSTLLRFKKPSQLTNDRKNKQT